MEENNERKVSKFSAGLNIIQRLDLLWKNCQHFKRNGKYERWNDELDTIWLELARDIDEKDFENKEKIEGYRTQFDKFDLDLRKHLPFQDGDGKFNIDDGKWIKRNGQYKTLMKKQLFLARLENEIGKGTSWGEQEDDWD